MVVIDTEGDFIYCLQVYSKYLEAENYRGTRRYCGNFDKRYFNSTTIIFDSQIMVKIV